MADKPLPYHVTFLPAAKEAEMQEKHGELWMDHDPEWYFETRDFRTKKDAVAFAQSDAVSGTFVQAFKKKNVRLEDHGLSYEYDEEDIDR